MYYFRYINLFSLKNFFGSVSSFNFCLSYSSISFPCNSIHVSIIDGTLGFYSLLFTFNKSEIILFSLFLLFKIIHKIIYFNTFHLHSKNLSINFHQELFPYFFSFTALELFALFFHFSALDNDVMDGIGRANPWHD